MAKRTREEIQAAIEKEYYAHKDRSFIAAPAPKPVTPAATPTRDPRALLEALQAVQYAFPDMRIGQLLVNAMPKDGPDLFYIENEDLRQALTDFLHKAMKG